MAAGHAAYYSWYTDIDSESHQYYFAVYFRVFYHERRFLLSPAAYLLVLYLWNIPKKVAPIICARNWHNTNETAVTEISFYMKYSRLWHNISHRKISSQYRTKSVMIGSLLAFADCSIDTRHWKLYIREYSWNIITVFCWHDIKNTSRPKILNQKEIGHRSTPPLRRFIFSTMQAILWAWANWMRLTTIMLIAYYSESLWIGC